MKTIELSTLISKLHPLVPKTSIMHSRTFLSILIPLFFSWIGGPTDECAAEPVWKAGTAKRVITPTTAVWLAGYGTKRAPDGKLHEIWMKALALEDDLGQRAVLVTSDFQGRSGQ